MSQFQIVLAFSGALGLALLSPIASAQYAVTDIGSLGGTYYHVASSGSAINASGQVTGYSALSVGGVRAFLYSAGLMINLGTLGGGFSAGQGVNDSGQVTGYSDVPTVGEFTHAFLYSNGTMQDLTPSVTESVGYAINASGQVTGFVNSVPFLYSNGSIEELAVVNRLGGIGYAINGRGQVTGEVEQGFVSSPDFMVALWTNGLLKEIGAVNNAGSDSVGYGINDSGAIVGELGARIGVDTHAFLYGAGAAQDLGTLGGKHSVAHAINASGQIVGFSDDHHGVEHAFLYSNGKMIDLNTLVSSDPLAKYVLLSDATAINDKGWIVANGKDSRTDEQRAYLLTTMAAPVPVPNLVGDAESVARSSIAATGLVLGAVTRQLSATAASGTVLSEIPAAGTEVDVGSAVNIFVSEGPATCADLAMVRTAFGSTLGSPNYNPKADINQDGVVNIVDLSTFAHDLPAGTTCH